VDRCLHGVIEAAGPERARYLLSHLSAAAQISGLQWSDSRNTPYTNTIHVEDEPPFPAVPMPWRPSSALQV
jgi:pyruvate dehydrogenase E1 component